VSIPRKNGTCHQSALLPASTNYFCVSQHDTIDRLLDDDSSSFNHIKWQWSGVVASIACRKSKSRSRSHESLDYNPEFCLESTCNLWVLTVPRASKMWCICVCVHACIHACMCAWCIEGGQGKRGDKRVYAWQMCTVHVCVSRSKRYTACLLWVCITWGTYYVLCGMIIRNRVTRFWKWDAWQYTEWRNDLPNKQRYEPGTVHLWMCYSQSHGWGEGHTRMSHVALVNHQWES